MRSHKPIVGLYDDAQLQTMEAALQRVVSVMHDMGIIAVSATDSYRKYVAGVVVQVGREGLFDEDEMTQRVLEELIRPRASNDSERKSTRRRLHRLPPLGAPA